MRRADAVVSNRYVRIASGACLALIAGLGLSLALPDYYVFLGITAVSAAICLLGLGVVTGSAGMIVLCQMSLAAVGAWIVSGMNDISAPGGPIVWLLCGGAVAAAIGTFVGLPALRLRGVNLAVVTIGFAAAGDLALTQEQFPGTTVYKVTPRPGLFLSDQWFFFFAIVILVLGGVAVALLQGSRMGAGWRSVAFSERGTASAGGSVRVIKMSAFTVSALLAGLSGGLITEQVGTATPTTFAPTQSLAIYVLAVVCGSYQIEMAVVGGILWVAIPQALQDLGISQNWGFVIFGLLGIQSLTTQSNLGEDLRRLLRRQARAKRGEVLTAHTEPVSSPDVTADDAPLGAAVLEVRDLKVQFGSIRAVDGVDLTLHEGEIVGLIGPNGAGKSTLIDALSGFLPRHSGRISLGGAHVDAFTPTKLARSGLRRTYQQDRVPVRLTVGAYVRFVAQRRIHRGEIDEVLEFLGCPRASSRLAQVDVGTRRLIEIAAHLASQPRVLLLDEPAAGLPHEERLNLARRLREIPKRFHTAVLIVEHDLDLVRTACTSVVALDFGQVIASGSRDVLSDPRVLRAYMGETELA